MARLDYQPLFGKMSPHSSPRKSSSGRIKDQTRETAEIEPNIWHDDYKYEITNVLGLLIDNIQIHINLTLALRYTFQILNIHKL